MTAAQWVSEGRYFERATGQRIFYRRSGNANGPTLLLCHGFPTSSFDYAELTRALEADFDILAFDFLGYGASDKPKGHSFSVNQSADIVEELLAHLQIREIHLVIHDYGGIVGQELLDRRRHGKLTVRIESVVLLNCGIVYEMYRPTRTQKLLALPMLGGLVASRITKEKMFAGLNAVRGKNKLTPARFEEHWSEIARQDGHKLAHRHIRYNAERARHAERWEAALQAFDGPLLLVWGMDDPVSGAHVLAAARPLLPRAQIVELDGVGHFPQDEAPEQVAAAIRAFLA